MMRLCIWTKIFACLAVPALSIQLELLPVMQVIYTANEEVARGLYNPAYKLLQMLPGPRSTGQLCMRRFHKIMQDLLQEVIPYLHCCQAVATYVATRSSLHHVSHRCCCALCQS